MLLLPSHTCTHMISPRSPLFVTWNKSSNWGRSSQLRGCIGTLEPRPLHTALKDYALTR
jgi:AMMECR1 domain-containing protein